MDSLALNLIQEKERADMMEAKKDTVTNLKLTGKMGVARPDLEPSYSHQASLSQRM